MPKPLTQRIKVQVDDAQMKKLRRNLKRTGKEGKKQSGVLASGFKKIGRVAKVAIATAAVTSMYSLVRATNSAVQAAAKFNSEFAQTRTIVDASDFQISELSSGLVDLSEEIPVSLGRLTQGLYNAISAGVPAGEALEFVEEAAEGAVGGATDVNTAVSGATAALNGFNIPAEETGRVMDAMFVAVREGKTRFGELSGQLGEVSGLASEAGVSLEETLAATSALTLTTNDTSKAVTQLRGVLQKLIKPSEKGKKLMEEMGVAFDKDAIASKGFRQALLDVVTAAKQTEEGVGALFENVEGLQGALNLTGTQSEAFGRILRDMDRKAGTSTEAFREMKDETTNLWKEVKNNLNAVMLRFGQKILPTVNTALKTTLGLFREFDSPLENLIDRLKEIPGIDPAVIQRLEAQQTAEAAEAFREQVEEEFEEATVKVDFEVGTQLRQVAGRDTNISEFEAVFEQVDLQETSLRELESRYESVTKRLERYANRLADAKAAGEELPGHFHERVNALEQMEQSLAENIDLWKRYESAQEAASEAQEAARSEGGRFTTDFTFPEPPGGGGGGPSEEALQARQKALDVLRQITRFQEKAAAATQEEKRLLDDLYAIRKNIRDLEKAMGDLSGEKRKEAEERLQLLRKQEAAVEQQLEDAGDLMAQADEFSKSLEAMEGFELPGFAKEKIQEQQQALQDLNEELTRLRNQRDAGEITEEQFQKRAAEATKEYQKELRKVYNALTDIIDLPPEIEKAFRQLFEAGSEGAGDFKEDVDEAVTTLEGLSRAADGIARLGDAFGGMSDAVRQALDATSSLLSNMAQLRAVGGFAKGGLAAAAPAIGIAAAGASLIPAIQDAVSGDDEEAARQREAMEDLRDQLTENARAIRENTEALFEQSRIAAGLSQQDLERAQEIRRMLKAGEGDRTALIREFSDIVGIDLSSITEPIEDELEGIQDLKKWDEMMRTAQLSKIMGVDFGESLDDDEISQIMNEILFGDDQEKKQKLLGALGLEGLDLSALQELENLPEDLGEKLGMFGESVAGAATKMQFLRDNGLENLDGAFDAFAEHVLGLDLGGAGIAEDAEGIAEEFQGRSMQSLMEEAMGLDLSTEEGRKRLQQIQEAIAQAIASGDFDFGSLTPEELDRILGIFADASEKTAENVRESGDKLTEAFQDIARAVRYAEISLSKQVEMFRDAIENSDLPGEVKLAILGTLDQIDLTTKEGREKMRSIVEGFITDPPPWFEMLSEEQQEMIISWFSRFAKGGGAPPDGQREGRVVNQIQRSITTRAGNLIVERLTEIALYAYI